MRYKTLFLGCLAGSVIGLCALGPSYGPEKGAFIKFSPCYQGNRFTLALGNKVPGLIHINQEWGPPYFRMKVAAFGWYGGLVGYSWNNVGLCDENPNSEEVKEKLYQHKANWIFTHPEEWRDYVLKYPQEGKTWYGRRWKQALRQFHRGELLD